MSDDEQQEDQLQLPQQQQPQARGQTLAQTIGRLPELVNQAHVSEMINLQVVAIDRLESTNKGLANCNVMAQRKLAATTKLFKKTSKQMSEAKRDLDVIYKKLSDLKAKILAERADLSDVKRHTPSSSNDSPTTKEIG